MCSERLKVCGFLFDKISKYCKKLGKVCRVVALLDAILGLILLIILLIRRLRSTSEYTETNVNNLIILGLHAFEITAAILLYEGVRREIICMIKLWFCYCVSRLVVLSLTAYPNLVSDSRTKIPLCVYAFEAAFTLFHVCQCICLLVLRHQTKSSTENIGSNIPAHAENCGESVVVPQPTLQQSVM